MNDELDDLDDDLEFQEDMFQESILALESHAYGLIDAVKELRTRRTAHRVKALISTNLPKLEECAKSIIRYLEAHKHD